MPTAHRGAKTIGPVIIAALSVAVVAIKLRSVSREDTETTMVVHASPAANQGNSGNKDSSAWWKDNSTVIIAILSVAVVAIRVLGASRGDPEIAYAIIQAGAAGTVLIATLVSTLGLLAIPASAVFVFYTWRERGTRPRSTNFILLGSVSVAMFYMAFNMAPVGFLVLSMLLVAVMAFLWRFRKNQKLKSFVVWLGFHVDDTKAFLFIGICLYILGIFLYELLSPTPWLPVQSISIPGQTFEGYVLSQGNGQTSILTSNPEEVISKPSQSILPATMQCTPSRFLEEQATLVYLIEDAIGKVATDEPCPSARYKS